MGDKFKKREKIYWIIISLLLLYVIYNFFISSIFASFSPAAEYGQTFASSLLSPPSVSIALFISMGFGILIGRKLKSNL